MTEFLEQIKDLGTFKVIGIIASIFLLIVFITWTISKVSWLTKHKSKMKVLEEERKRQIAFENEVHNFIQEEIRRQLVEYGLIEDKKYKYDFGEKGLKLE